MTGVQWLTLSAVRPRPAIYLLLLAVLVYKQQGQGPFLRAALLPYPSAPIPLLVHRFHHMVRFPHYFFHMLHHLLHRVHVLLHMLLHLLLTLHVLCRNGNDEQGDDAKDGYIGYNRGD